MNLSETSDIRCACLVADEHLAEFLALKAGGAAAAARWAYNREIQFMRDPLFQLLSASLDPLTWYEDVLPRWAQSKWQQLHECS